MGWSLQLPKPTICTTIPGVSQRLHFCDQARTPHKIKKKLARPKFSSCLGLDVLGGKGHYLLQARAK